MSMKKCNRITSIREKGEGLRNNQNTGRLNYSFLASRQVFINWLVSMT